MMVMMTTIKIRNSQAFWILITGFHRMILPIHLFVIGNHPQESHLPYYPNLLLLSSLSTILLSSTRWKGGTTGNKKQFLDSRC